MLRKMLRFSLAAIVMAAIMISGAIQAFGADYYATNDVFVRKSADINSEIISGYARGEIVSVVESAGDWWYKVRLGSGATGYASALFVHQPEDNVDTSGAVLKTVNTPYLNVRAGASLDWLVVGMLMQGEEVYVLETYDNGWVKATGYGFTAYVNGKYLK